MTLSDLQIIYKKTYLDWVRTCEAYEVKKSRSSKEEIDNLKRRKESMAKDLKVLRIRMKTI